MRAHIFRKNCVIYQDLRLDHLYFITMQLPQQRELPMKQQVSTIEATRSVRHVLEKPRSQKPPLRETEGVRRLII